MSDSDSDASGELPSAPGAPASPSPPPSPPPTSPPPSPPPSQPPPSPPDSDHEDDPFAEEDGNEQPSFPAFQVLLRIIKDGHISLETLKHALSLDEHFNEIITKIKSGQRVLNFKLTDGILFRESQGTDKICLPENLLEHVFWNEHHSMHGQHRSPSQICNTLMKTYYAVNMFKKFTGFANRCHFCMVNKPNNSKAQVIQVDMKVTAPRQVWGFDICGGLSVTKLGHSLIYIYVDTFSNYVQLIPASSKSADSIINSIKNNILTPFGPPLAIRSDGEHGLVTSQAAKEFTASHGVQVLPTAVLFAVDQRSL